MYNLNEEEMFADISADTAIIINSITGIYFGLNKAGTIIFNCIINGYEIKDVVTVLQNVKGCPQNIETRVKIFIDDLLSKKIIIQSKTAVKKDIQINSSILLEDKFEFKAGEFADAQELLLADPVHDVEKDEGWQPIFKEIQNDNKK